MIHRVCSAFAISTDGCWRPGRYDTERTARYAFQFADEVLHGLQDAVNPDGIITWEMLRETRKRMST